MIQELRSGHFELLRRTLERARTLSPFYSKSLASTSTSISSLSELNALPFLSRNDLTEHLESIIIPTTEPFCLNTTHGTSTDPGMATNSRMPRRPLIFFKDIEELSLRVEIQSSLHPPGEKRPLVCQLINLEHGIDPATFGPGCFCMPLESIRHFNTICSLLKKRFQFDGFQDHVSVLSGSLRMIKVFTLLCLQRSVPIKNFSVELVASYGNQLTTRWRKLLEDAWQAPIHDVYGLSEVPGLHAHWCRHCGSFHFSNLALVETLDVLENTLTSRGLARLVGTSLYPLSSAIPIIRYCTEDLIEVGEVCDQTGLNGITYVGREGATLLNGRKVLLSPVIVHEILDEFPDVATQEFDFADKLGLAFTGGFKKWKSFRKDEELVVSIELRWPPVHYVDRASELTAMLRKRILEQSSELAAQESAGLKFSVLLLPPDSIDDFLIY
jgi:phenylacetate-coenzyme A ligase PaaK-like adenylate-forming protein